MVYEKDKVLPHHDIPKNKKAVAGFHNSNLKEKSMAECGKTESDLEKLYHEANRRRVQASLEKLKALRGNKDEFEQPRNLAAGFNNTSQGLASELNSYDQKIDNNKCNVSEENDLEVVKLQMEKANRRRLQACLDKLNASCDEKNKLKQSRILADGFPIETEVLSSDSNSYEQKTNKSKSKCEASVKIINSSKQKVNVNQKFIPLNNGVSCSNAINTLSANTESTNLNQFVDMSDSEDLLCDISEKRNENSSDSDRDETFIKLSTQLQHSDPKHMVFNELSMWEKQKVPIVQIGIGIPDPVLNIEGAWFSKHVLRVLKEIKFYGPSCIQSVVWPTIDRGRSMIVVAPPHAGKTISYVLPLVSHFTTGVTSAEKDSGPISIILCSSWMKAQVVNDYFNLFLGDFHMKIVTLCTVGGNYKNKMQTLINNCDILIATPHCLLKFFEEKAINFSRLEEFILDDGSAIMDNHKKELKRIFLCLMEARKITQCSPQLIMCADRWNKNFQIIIDKIMLSPLLFFSSFLEAAVYAKVPISVHICRTTVEKKVALLDIVKNAGRVVICTTNASEALDVHHFLRHFHHKSFLVNEEMEHYLVDDVIKSWKSANCDDVSPCLVITDQSLSKMCISNANCLIHYDIPPKSRLQFGNRFSCIAEHFKGKVSRQSCICHILMMESEYRYAPHFIEIIENGCGTPSKQLVELNKKQLKDKNILGDLCHYMKAFGYCKKHCCKSRHVVDPTTDMPQIIPFEGDVHGLVTHIVDASHFYMRVMKYLDPVSNKTVSLNVPYAEIGFQLKEYYSNVSKEMKVEVPVIGENYVLQEENKLFFRIKILEYMPEIPNRLAQWKILYLDEGWIKYCKKLNLYKLTNQIKLPEPLAVEVYVCNISTPDSSLDWNPQTTQLVSNFLKGKEIHGKIALCIGKTLWLDPLVVAIRLCDGNYVYPFKVNEKLFDYGHALKNKKHLTLLRKACVDKIPLPQVTKPKDKKEIIEEKPSINYAFLDCDEHEDVYVSSVVSPHQFYVQRAKFVECLDDLLEKINLQVENRKLKKACIIQKDMVCIAPFHEDNRYYRAIVTDIASDDEVCVFYVDFGDTGKTSRKNIYPLSAEFLLLPFQAIECELAGIASPHGGWSQSAIDTLTTLTRDESYDMKILLLKAYKKTNCYTGGSHCVIDLWDNDRNLSQQLLQAGFGIPSEIPLESSTKVAHNNLTSQSSNSAFDLNNKYSVSSEDEELDPEDKDTAAEFYGVLAKMMAEEYNLIPQPKATITEVSSDEEVLKKCKITDMPLANGKCNNLKEVFPKFSQFKNISSSEPSSSRPPIMWWDTTEELNILVNLKDIKMYQLDVTDEDLSFSTIIAGVHYSTEEKFYEKIHSSTAKMCQSIQGINIVAKKYTPFKWPRFTKEKRKFFHIKYDLVHINDSDPEESPKAFDQELMRYRYEMDEESSTTDEEETYVEPWKEFAQPKDIFNQMIS